MARRTPGGDRVNAGAAITAACQDDRLCDLIRLSLDAELERTRRAEKMQALSEDCHDHAHNWPTNADLIADVAKLGYLDGPVLDTTYGEGTFWKMWRPNDLTACDIDPAKSPIGYSVDFTSLPFKAGMFRAVRVRPSVQVERHAGSRGRRSVRRRPKGHDRGPAETDSGRAARVRPGDRHGRTPSRQVPGPSCLRGHVVADGHGVVVAVGPVGCWGLYEGRLVRSARQASAAADGGAHAEARPRSAVNIVGVQEVGVTLYCANPSCSAQLDDRKAAELATYAAIDHYVRRHGWVLDDDGELWCGRCALEQMQ